MKVLVACEFSGIVRDAFKERGHDAWSCDLLPTEKPGQHIQGDVLEIFNDGWDLMIAHPPCTHLAVSGAGWFKEKIADGRQQQGIDFFMQFINAPIEKWCIENPVGIMSKIYRPPDQIIQPYYFGDSYQKTTCLWLKNLLPLHHKDKPDLFDSVVTHTDKGEFFEWQDGRTGKLKRQPLWFKEARSLPPEERAKVRSQTFPGIAKAMAEQWG